MTVSKDAAETLAARALAWIARTDDLMPVFLGSSGMGMDDLRTASEDPHFLGGVLDFLLMDDAWVVAFCDQEGIPYDRPLQARAALPGGAEVHWT